MANSPDTARKLRFIRRLAGMRGFLTHLLAYLLVSMIFFLLGPKGEPVLLMVGWGIGLLVHGLAALGPGQFVGSRAEARMLDRLCGREGALP